MSDLIWVAEVGPLTVNPFTGQLQTSQSFTVVGSYLHYWTPEWRAAVFSSYGEQSFSQSARAAQGASYGLVSGITGAPAFGTNAVGVPGTRFYQLSQALRDKLVSDARFQGAANLLVMPNLDAANITLTALAASSSSPTLGPMLLGLSQPIHVLAEASNPSVRN